MEMTSKTLVAGLDTREALQAIDEIDNRYDAYAFLKNFSKANSYKYFSVMRIPPEAEQRLSDQFLVTNWPEEFIREYDELSLLVNSPTFAQLRRSVRPQYWELDEASARRQEDERRKAAELFMRYGFVRGVYLPVHDKKANRGAVSFTGERTPPCLNETGQLTLVAIHLFDRLGEVAQIDKPQADIKLSDRERQCLVWTAAGKTSAEIAAILGLSEHTVNQYITTACQKLGTVNRAQAVAKAIRDKIID
jgi:DNA-binding CsgD family transcriptional regulator